MCLMFIERFHVRTPNRKNEILNSLSTSVVSGMYNFTKQSTSGLAQHCFPRGLMVACMYTHMMYSLAKSNNI